MAYNSSTTYGEIVRTASKVLNENDVLSIGKRGLAQLFLSELLGLDKNTSLAELEVAYRAASKRKEVPEDTEDFWIFIEKDYLELESEPRQRFTELSIKVSEDLSKIRKNLDFIVKEKNALEEKKRQEGRLGADERYYRNQLDYFENKNVVACDEIVEFMAKGIRRESVRRASKKPRFALSFDAFFGNSPYAFGRGFGGPLGDSYDVRSLDEFSNKFLDLPASSYREIVGKCKQSTELFKDIALEYFAGADEFPGVRKKLERLVEKSHILSRRKLVIDTMLRHFESGDYISFVSIAPLQIEGIFADICREIGISESQLDISSLNDKLSHIEGKMSGFFFFEYYSFKFPVLRNLVAHGGLVDGDLENTALHLMLDLLPVCKLTASDDIPINHALDVLDKASKKSYKDLIAWLDLRGTVDIPEFYGLSEKIALVDGLFSTQAFWDFLVDRLKETKEVANIKTSAPIKIAGKIKIAKLADEQAGTFLKHQFVLQLLQ